VSKAEGKPRLGPSGTLAAQFLQTEITPLLALVGLLLGLFAIAVTPREEEPQIDVTFANVFIGYPGASASEVEQLVSTPMERILSEIDGVEHIYSVSRPGNSVLTVQFEVGEPRDEAIVRLYNAVYSNRDWMPANIGVLPALIKPRGIDDVPIVTGTLWSEDLRIGAHELQRVAHVLETELQRVPGTRDIYTIGGPDRVVSVRLDPERLAGFDIDFEQLRGALASANASAEAGSFASNNEEVLVQAGAFISEPEEVAELVVGARDGRPVFLRDVASVALGPDLPTARVTFGLGPQNDAGLAAGTQHPAVTIAVAKKPGTNAVDVANAVIDRFQQLQGALVPDGMHATITRNYGQTADDKAQTLIKKLLFATLSVIVLVGVALGRREAVVVGAAVVITLAVTLFASWAWGFTLNRVSLFALIFSIGILVDDAIVVVENAHRHLHIGGLPLARSIPLAVDEVGGPTILATFTVIAALLPMAFVTGLMGPYMAPIPINASMGMLISLLVAFVFTPWLFFKVFRRQAQAHKDAEHSGEQTDRLYTFLYAGFDKYLRPFLSGRAGRRRRLAMLGVVLTLITLSMALVAVQWVVMKMLPFDNKSEFQIVVDMPEGTPVEQTQRVLDELALELTSLPEVTNYQTYAGTAAPINFNGLVRQYYLRAEPHQGDIQVNLVDRTRRDRQSHEIAMAARPLLQVIGERFDANVKIVEVPPGPPVIAPLVAEIYGASGEQREATARAVRAVFEATPDIVDVDDTLEAPQPRLLVSVDRQRAARLGVSQSRIVAAIATAIGGEDASYLHDEASRRPVPIRLELDESAKADVAAIARLRVRNALGSLVPLSEVVRFTQTTREQAIYHKDLLPMVLVTGDQSGRLDSPLYGMAAIASGLGDTAEPNGGVEQYLVRQPPDPYRPSLKWDGEWQVTYETFRDMGLAYAVGLVLIYLLVVAQFRSYSVPLIIMAPIPLTLIGILPGHALLGRQFTATSMIGMIALAGIIVRNSILLVDFIRQEVARGVPLADAVVNAGAVRARPIALTGLAAMAGAFFILDDPIFSGLAVSLIFGILVSTLLTLVVIPVVYYAYRYPSEDSSVTTPPDG